MPDNEKNLGPPLIAIAGSVDPRRNPRPAEASGTQPQLYPYAVEVKTEEAISACRLLGEALAEAGYGLLIYSTAKKYAELHVAEAYLEHPDAIRIEVRRPEKFEDREEQEQELLHPSTPDVVQVTVSEIHDWQVAFYDSLADAAGVLVIGGGNSALIAGVVATSFEKPLIPLSYYGGAGRQLRDFLVQLRAKSPNSSAWLLGGDEEWSRAGRAVNSANAASQVVRLFAHQMQKKASRDLANSARALEEKRTAEARVRRQQLNQLAWRYLVLTLIIFVVWLIVEASVQHPLTIVIGGLATGVLGGLVGFHVRWLRQPRESDRNPPEQADSPVLGALAGVIAILLFFFAQATTNDKFFDLTGQEGILIVCYALLTALVGGAAFEAIFERARATISKDSAGSDGNT